MVGATSEEGCVVTNGMSQHSRRERNANSGLVVNITKEDLEPWGRWSGDPLAGVAFQRHWEQRAFEAGGKPMRPLPNGSRITSPTDPARTFQVRRDLWWAPISQGSAWAP